MYKWLARECGMLIEASGVMQPPLAMLWRCILDSHSVMAGRRSRSRSAMVWVVQSDLAVKAHNCLGGPELERAL